MDLALGRADVALRAAVGAVLSGIAAEHVPTRAAVELSFPRQPSM
jgi:hypothetical protein